MLLNLAEENTRTPSAVVAQMVNDLKLGKRIHEAIYIG